jgi:uncharacterized protein involved in exopolysaccharide biosynthesis
MLLGSTIVVLLPDQYEASSRVYVDTDSLMGPLLKGIAVEDDPSQQLAIMQSTLLSRPNLTDVARAVFPGMAANNEVKVEDAIDRLKSRTVVEVEGKKLFRIAYVESDPRLAKDVVQSFLNIFVEGNLGQDRSDMENAQSFIAKQLAIYQEQLRDTEKRMAEFKAKHSDVISSSRGSFSQQLEKALADVEQASAEVAQAKNRERSLPAPKTSQQSSPSASPEDEAVDPTQVKLGELRAELNKKRSIYSDQHPDVVLLERQLEALETHNAQGAIARLALANETLKRLQDTASSAAIVETEMADLNRDYSVLKQKYDELRVRAESARISRDARTDTASLRFRIIEPPEVPARPSGPKRTLLLLAVLCASIGGGLAFAFLLSEMDDTFSTPRRLTAAFNLPLLGSVCLIPNKADEEKRHFDAMAVSVGTGSMVVLCVLLIALSSGVFRSLIDLTPLRQLANSLLGPGA